MASILNIAFTFIKINNRPIFNGGSIMSKWLFLLLLLTASYAVSVTVELVNLNAEHHTLIMAYQTLYAHINDVQASTVTISCPN